MALGIIEPRKDAERSGGVADSGGPEPEYVRHLRSGVAAGSDVRQRQGHANAKWGERQVPVLLPQHAVQGESERVAAVGRRRDRSER